MESHKGIQKASSRENSIAKIRCSLRRVNNTREFPMLVLSFNTARREGSIHRHDLWAYLQFFLFRRLMIKYLQRQRRSAVDIAGVPIRHGQTTLLMVSPEALLLCKRFISEEWKRCVGHAMVPKQGDFSVLIACMLRFGDSK
jgi:hypothetical protein